MPAEPNPTQDYLLAGGGLQNCLLALLVLDERPEARVTLVDRGDRLGGNQTWSFHAADLPARCEPALGPAVHRSWDDYDVRFPAYERTVDSGYRTILSRELHALVEQRLAEVPHGRLLLRTEIESVGRDHVTLADGTTLHGRVVVDARGLAARPADAGAGYQKFLGLELRLRRPNPSTRPMLMDACVPQVDGFRFFYVLPLSPDRVLVEDTRFSDTPDLDPDEMGAGVLAYAAENGLDVDETVRSESGVLPMPWTMPTTWTHDLPLRAGYAGGFLHPATGFSFPIAARLARHLADHGADAPLDGWEAFLRRHRRQYRYAALLNRLAFSAYGPTERYHVFERFYRLRTPLIERFYRLELSPADQARLLVGRPPRGFSFRRVVRHARAARDDRRRTGAEANPTGGTE